LHSKQTQIFEPVMIALSVASHENHAIVRRPSHSACRSDPNEKYFCPMICTSTARQKTSEKERLVPLISDYRLNRLV
jgi:hypothetical protein